MGCLQIYSDWSGQHLNRTKLGIISSRNVLQETRRLLSQRVNICGMMGRESFLRNPLFLTKSRTKDFYFLEGEGS